MQVAGSLAWSLQMRFKHEFACARPDEYSPQVQPMIPTPRHSAYPMGHICEAAAAVQMLSHLSSVSLKNGRSWESLNQQLWRLAWRVGDNRVIAGVHFPVDMLGGLVLGVWVGDYIANACKTGKVAALTELRKFDPEGRSCSEIMSILSNNHKPNELLSKIINMDVKPVVDKKNTESKSNSEIWKLALGEWKHN